MEKLFESALGISSPWYIDEIDFNVEKNILNKRGGQAVFRKRGGQAVFRALGAYASCTLPLYISFFKRIILDSKSASSIRVASQIVLLSTAKYSCSLFSLMGTDRS